MSLDQTQFPHVVTVLPLPQVKVVEGPFGVCVETATHGIVGKPQLVTVCLRNNTSRIQAFKLNASANQDFLLAGKSHVFFSSCYQFQVPTCL